MLTELYKNNIPDRLQDKNTYYYKTKNKNHPLINYLGCVILRISIGLLIFNKILPNIVIYILSILIIIFFTDKFLNSPSTWKNYPRTVLVYSILPIFTKQKTDHNYGGLLIIIDALMGLQSRYIQNNFLN